MSNQDLKKKVKFSDEVEKTQSAYKQKLNPPDGIPTDFFACNGRQEIDDGHLDEIFNDPKIPAVVTLDSYWTLNHPKPLIS